jgi:polar amino acid transport system substrate-binding protein
MSMPPRHPNRRGIVTATARPLRDRTMRPWSPLFVLTLVSAMAAAAEPLRVGMELSYPPFEMTDQAGTPTGVSVRLAEALAKDLGRELVIENIAFDGLIPALKTGKIDCIISSLTATPERARSIAFSEPYLKTGLALLVATKSPVQSAADLDAAGRVVAVKKGTTGHQYAAASLKLARVLVLDKESAAVMEVAQGKADAFIYDSLSVYRSHMRHPDTTRALLRPFREETWAVGLRRGDDALKRQVDEFLERFRADGGFEKLGDEFLAEEKAFFKRAVVPFYF